MNEVIDGLTLAQALTASPPQQHPIAAQPRQLTVIQHAISTGATPAELREILALQVTLDEHELRLMRERRAMVEEDRKVASVLAFRRDFAAFRGENIVVAKSKRVDRGNAGSFMQAELYAIAQQLSPAMSRHGFSFRHDQRFGNKEFPADGRNELIPFGTMLPEPWVYVTCFLEHRDGHFERLDLDGPPDDGKANGLIQNMQSAASMLKRLSLLALTGTATGGEDDENGMRGKRKPPGPDGDDAADADADLLLDAGRTAAMAGMASLTAWWGALTAKQRTNMNSEFGALRRGATQADKEGAK